MRFLPLLVLIACGGSSSESTDPSDDTTETETATETETSRPQTTGTTPTETSTPTSIETDSVDTGVASTGTSIEEIDCAGASDAITIITPSELDAMLDDKDFLLVNVHIPYAGEIPGTDAHIRYTDTSALEDGIGPEGTKVVLYCRTGPMSATAAADLRDRGYCNIYDMPAGMNGWESAGYTLDP